MHRVLRPGLSLVLVVFTLTQPLIGFTQAGAGYGVWASWMPVGHEWLTRRSVLELLGNDPYYGNDSNDPRKSWSSAAGGGLAQNVDLSTAQSEVSRIKANKISSDPYKSVYDAVYSAVIGDRWVDIGGFNVSKARMSKYNCFDSVAQNPPAAQYDHFLRGYSDNGPSGAATAASAANSRFLQYFQDAATAPSERILVWDGGGVSQLVEVDLNYFLFGRALHVLQDSFSMDHCVRVIQKTNNVVTDRYTKLRQVKSYVCTPGSEQHSHQNPGTSANYGPQDFIWKSSPNFNASNMRENALVAMEATKDAWAAFIRTMAVPPDQRAATAQQQAFPIVLSWTSFSSDDMANWYNVVPPDSTWVQPDTSLTGPGSQKYCVQNSLGVGSGNIADFITQVNTGQANCLYNVIAADGYQDVNDVYMKMPYNWGWRSSSWESIPADYAAPVLQAHGGTRVGLQNLGTKAWLYAPSIANFQQVAANGQSPLALIQIAAASNYSMFRLTYSPKFFLNIQQGGTPYGMMVLLQPSDSSHIPVTTATTYGAVYLKDIATGNPACAATTGPVAANAFCDPTSPYSQWTISKQ